MHNKKLDFKKFLENIYGNIGGMVSQDVSQISTSNADFTKSQIGGKKSPIRSDISAQMKKKPTA